MQTPEERFVELLKGPTARPTAPSEDSAVEKEMAKSDPDFKAPVTIQNLFTHHDTHPVVLNFAMMKQFGIEWVGWEPETCWAEIQREFKTQVSELSRAKLQVIRTLAVSNAPWEQWQVFEKVIQGLNNNIPNFEIMQAPSLEQLYAGIDIMEQLRTVEFDHEVKLYAAAAVLHENVTFVPAPLDFLQAEVSQPYYRCKDCGNQDSALFHDGTCDTCTKKFHVDQGLSMKPNQELASKGIGKSMELFLKYDPTDVETKWDQVNTKATADVDLEENEVDIQVAKLLVARDYMNIRRRQLADQLTGLKSWLGASV